MNKISKGKSKAKKVIIAILAIIAALFVLMLSIAACSGSGDSGNAKTYSDAVQKYARANMTRHTTSSAE